MVEIEEVSNPTTTTTTSTDADESTPLLSNPDPMHQPESPARVRSVRTKVPEAEVHVYRKGQGPIDVVKCSLAGWDQDQLDVREILHKYGFKSLFAFNPKSGRGTPIMFNVRNGRSILTYSDGAVIHVDGEPQDSLIKPITKILVGVAAITILIVLAMKEIPDWARKLNFSGGQIPPWILACAVIVFTRMRKRTKDFLEKRR